jgi:hypothetical protein
MSLKNKIICKNLEEIVDLFLNQKINNIIDNPILEGFFIKPEKQSECIIFIDSKLKNSIRCYFYNDNIILDKNEKVKITNSKIDLLLVERGIKFFESNLILLIESFEIIKNDSSEIKTIPLNINRISDIKKKVMKKLDEYIKQILSKYYNLELTNKINAQTFINNKSQNKQINLSIFKMIQKILKSSNQGFLLNENLGLKEPFKYMISPNDDDFDLTNNILSQVNWKNLYNNMPTIIENKSKENNKYKGEIISIKDLRLKNNMEIEKEKFLSRKLKRCEINEDEIKNIPNNLNELINDYGDVNVNIGQSLIDKYHLYKKYMKLIHTEKIK